MLEFLSKREGGATSSNAGYLLNWASELSQRDLVLQTPVQFIEAPLRLVTTDRVSEYACRYLCVIASARIHRGSGGWGLFTPDWWKERKAESLEALAALREAMKAAPETERS